MSFTSWQRVLRERWWAQFLAPVRARRTDGGKREPGSLDRGQRPGNREAIRPAGTFVEPSSRHAAHDCSRRRPASASSTVLYPRRYALKNRERLNRLLMLLQLHVNGHDDAQAYAKAIRLQLEAKGRPLQPRRAIADPAGSSSLR